MIAHAHNPDYCRCDNCSVERSLTATGGWEWIDDGREIPAEPKRRHPAWLLVGFAMLAAIAVLLAFVYLESVQ